MTIQTIKDRMSALNSELAEIKAKAIAQGKVLFEDACKMLFERHPDLLAFQWTQYTPYFADGDPCEFGVNDVYCRFASLDKADEESVDGYLEDDDEDDDGNGERFWSFYASNKTPQADIEREVIEIHQLIDESVYQDLFGDHVKVLVTRDGAETEEYSHD